MTASAYSLSAAVPSDGMTVIEGSTVIGGLHGEQLRHHHCDWCKSWLFTRIEPDPGFVNIRATLLDDTSWFVPFIETGRNEALPWVTTPAKHSYAEFPSMEAYFELIAEYTAENG